MLHLQTELEQAEERMTHLQELDEWRNSMEERVNQAEEKIRGLEKEIEELKHG
jgi:DNA repair exonuclease SbcCD ATPase subunit